MINERRKRLTDDLLSELIRAEDHGDRQRRRIAHDGGQPVDGGNGHHAKSAVGVGASLVSSSRSVAMLIGYPELAMRAVEESMRHSPSVCSTVRTVLEDATYGGYTFPAGSFIILNTFAANRDPEVYSDPERFDMTRESPPTIVTFGGGVHYCLGANLARMELAGALTVLARRMPNPRRIGAGALEADARHERADRADRRVRPRAARRPGETSIERDEISTARSPS